MYSTIFEACGGYVAVLFWGRVVIRCPSRYTDIRGDEPLEEFVSRHGGDKLLADYLSECLRA
jgi:hypothetical protein